MPIFDFLYNNRAKWLSFGMILSVELGNKFSLAIRQLADTKGIL